MQLTNRPRPEGSLYAPGVALTRMVTVREFVLDHAPELAEHFTDDEDVYAALVAAAHAEARRFGLPASPDGAYPPIIWDVAWDNLERHAG